MLRYEGACGLELAAVGRRGRLDEEVEQRLHHVARHLWIAVAVFDGEEVAGLRPDLDLPAEVLDHALAPLDAVDAQVEIGARDHALDVWAAQQGPLQHLDLARRRAVDGDAAQQRAEDSVRIGVHTRGRQILVRHEQHGDPAGDADEPGEQQGLPAVARRRHDDTPCLEQDVHPIRTTPAG